MLMRTPAQARILSIWGKVKAGHKARRKSQMLAMVASSSESELGRWPLSL